MKYLILIGDSIGQRKDRSSTENNKRKPLSYTGRVKYVATKMPISVQDDVNLRALVIAILGAPRKSYLL